MEANRARDWTMTVASVNASAECKAGSPAIGTIVRPSRRGH